MHGMVAEMTEIPMSSSCQTTGSAMARGQAASLARRNLTVEERKMRDVAATLVGDEVSIDEIHGAVRL